MRKSLLCLALIGLLFACQRPVNTSPAPRLKNAMASFLKKSVGKDSGQITFEVLDVNYFTDKDFYECEFQVRMRAPGTDTTGLMKARVSNDFVTVTRKW